MAGPRTEAKEEEKKESPVKTLQREIAGQRRHEIPMLAPRKTYKFKGSKFEKFSGALTAELKKIEDLNFGPGVAADAEKKAFLAEGKKINEKMEKLDKDYFEAVMNGHPVDEQKHKEAIEKLRQEYAAAREPLEAKLSTYLPPNPQDPAYPQRGVEEKKAIDAFKTAEEKVFTDYPGNHDKEMQVLAGKAKEDGLTARSFAYAYHQDYLGDQWNKQWEKMIPVDMLDFEEIRKRKEDIEQAQNDHKDEPDAEFADHVARDAALKALERYRANRDKPAKFFIDTKPPFWIERTKGSDGMTYTAYCPEGIDEKNFEKVAKKLLHLSGMAEGKSAIEVDFKSPENQDDAVLQVEKLKSIIEQASKSIPPIKVTLGPGAERALMMCGDRRSTKVSTWKVVLGAALAGGLAPMLGPLALVLGGIIATRPDGDIAGDFIKGSGRSLREEVSGLLDENHVRVAKDRTGELQDSKEQTAKDAKELLTKQETELKEIIDNSEGDLGQAAGAGAIGPELDPAQEFKEFTDMVAARHPPQTDMEVIQTEVNRLNTQADKLKDIQDELSRQLMLVDGLIAEDPRNMTEINNRLDRIRVLEEQHKLQLIRVDDQCRRLEREGDPAGILHKMITGEPGIAAPKGDDQKAILQGHINNVRAIRAKCSHLFGGQPPALGPDSSLRQQIAERRAAADAPQVAPGGIAGGPGHHHA